MCLWVDVVLCFDIVKKIRKSRKSYGREVSFKKFVLFRGRND